MHNFYTYFIGNCLSIICLVVASTHSQATTSFTFSESSHTLIACTDQYEVIVNKSPYFFSIRKNKSVILQLDSLQGTYIKRGNRQRYCTKVDGWQKQENGLLLVVDSEPMGAKAEVFFTFGTDDIEIEIRTPGIINNELIGQNFSIQSGGHWYGGNVTSASHWPLESGSISLDPFYATQNQTSPVWLTSSGTGIVIETYKLLGFHLNKNKEGRFTFHVPNTASISYKIAIGNTIVDAYRRCINWLGKPQVVPPKEYFTDPIFNTWIEFFWDVNQKGLLTYAQNIRTHGFPASILDIDDKWSTKYGDFDFDPAKFPDPEGLIAQLKEMKFKMALWVTPFIEPAARNYTYALSKKYLLMDEKGKKPYITKWWNGSAAIIDLSNPEAHAWYLDQLKSLQRKYGVSGFKLDAGDAEFLIKPFKSYGNISANRYTDLFAELGKHFEVNELRVSWLTQRLGLVQRLRDKAPNWEKEEGLGTIVPHGMAESLIGYPYFCPDMIGGGLESGFKENKIDAELFVRWTQASALMPMMQYSYAPWKLDSTSVSICLKYSKLHTDLGDYIYSLARQASVDGMPITRPLFFVDPADQNTYTISDQFMLGEKLLVAPVLKKGAVSRDIYLPKGTWSDLWTGRIYQGNTTLQHFSAPIDILPVFVKIY